MSSRHFPVRPNLEQLKHQAKDLLHALRRGDADALAEARLHCAGPIDPATAKLSQAQLVLARSYGLPSWPRLVLACRMTHALWQGDVETVRELVLRHPKLLHEDARGVQSHWGPPLSYAANLGQDAIIDMLRQLGATDIQYAFERACLQGRIATARRLFAMGARPVAGSVMGACETHCAPGLELLLDLGAELVDRDGDPRAPVAALLESSGRLPEGKHRCLDLVARRGVALPDTPPLAIHRGRIDLLAAHLDRDPHLFTRTFTHEEIYPPSLGCHADHSLALCGTPLDGATLLHLAVDCDEIEMARWMIAQGAEVDAVAAVDNEGFGGHTPLFGTVVSQAYRVYRRMDDEFARLLLDHGADPNRRASLQKRLRFVADESLHSYRDVTPRAWGEQFHDQDWVNESVLALLAARGGLT